ncbi:TetR/AcrR family transcriptional regulator [Amycolatopsis sp. A133]|uniref:TetR/AcrR family transcriptional regulator n=1 Tax=Amycolatopsis sp. A133 TaxID=3064472 RepID=UPI0027F8C0C7|nr:TetR/AcrR family transcriptional regulator [Amycolatopsis sp. A133]MDQ7807854.1 TetR/AcrR family transcriptional regulator [Amycolatopsis sp. A133]
MGTRDQLVDSARELLWERGYVGTSPRAIQQRAGAGQGSMYHHFAGKKELALAAVRRTAEELLAAADGQLCGPGTAVDRITAYLRREREVLKGCPIGRLTQDPEIVADPVLRAPVDETLTRLRARLAEVLGEGRAAGELPAGLDTTALAATIVAVLQGGYVLARAANSPEPFDQAVSGLLALLTAR